MSDQAFASWSGGKDCCLAFYRTVAAGIKIRSLLNMISEDGMMSRSHGLEAKWVRMQAQAIGIPIIQKPTTNTDYEAEFKGALSNFKQEGITTGIFGDIDFNAHREWIDRVCNDSGIIPRLPLWEENQGRLLKEFVEAGFEAIVVATNSEFLGEEWLGRKLDNNFMFELSRLQGITMCGEAGEYHTFVLDGPMFQKKLVITQASNVFRDGHWFLDVTGCEIREKSGNRRNP